jgi:transcriptional regulator GlxA family with amidase domain
MGKGAHDAAMWTVIFVVYDDLQLTDLAGPIDVLDTANIQGADPLYHTLLASPDGRSVRSSSGVEIGVDASLHQLHRRRAR